MSISTILPSLTVALNTAADGAVIVLTPHGQWDWRLFVDLYTGVHKHLAEYPLALIIDLQIRAR